MPAVVNLGAEPHNMELCEVPVPEIGDDDVLLAVQAVGVPFAVPFPLPGCDRKGSAL